jgi:hypothetical protein
MLLLQWKLHFMSISTLAKIRSFSHLKAFISIFFFKLANIVIVQMLGLTEDEQTFSTFFFMKSKLRNHFSEHLHAIIGMYL